MIFRIGRSWCLLIGLLMMCREASAQAPDPIRETIWIEAEHLQGVRGYCWPMGQPAMKKTDGHWGLSGPGWAAEWNQGGESGFLSIATAADDVICAYPNVERWKTIDSYPAVIVTGEIELTAAEGERLARHVAQGGTLVVADGHLTGPGLAALKLPASGPAQVGRGYRWRLGGEGENRTAQGRLVLLMNPAGQEKPQQGITPTDFRQNRRVILRPRVPVTTARDRLQSDDRLELRDGTLELEVSAGGVRLIELHE